jgi:microcystin-dependent protein
MVAYPAALANLSNPLGTNSMADPAILHSLQHTNANDEIEAVQAELGLDPSGAYNTVAARLTGIETGLGNAVPPGVMFPWGGTAAPTGFFLCYGQVLLRASYPALFANIGTQYNTGGELATEFRMPDGRGRFLLGLDNMGGTDAGRVSTANAVGTAGGAETVVLDNTNLPAHTHTVNHGHASTFAVSSMTGSSGGHSVDHSHTVPDHAHSAYSYGGNGAHAHTVFMADAGGLGGGGSLVRKGYNGSGEGTSTGGGHEHNIGVNGSGAIGTTGASVNHTHTIDHGHAMTGAVTDFAGSSGSTGSGAAVNKMPPFLTVNIIIKY